MPTFAELTLDICYTCFLIQHKIFWYRVDSQGVEIMEGDFGS